MEQTTSKTTASRRGMPRSIRLRLLLWYGTLLTLALGFFAALILVLTTDAINQGVESAINAEARIVTSDLRREFSPTPPYWPTRLSLPTISSYSEPGVVIEILNTQGQVLYATNSGTTPAIPLSPDIFRSLLAGQTPIWYTTGVRGEQVHVEALAIHAPGAGATSSAGARTGPVIGVLLVAKSLAEVNATLLLIRVLLLVIGLGTLVLTLVGSWVLATRVLRPLAEIVITARAIAASTARGTRLANLSQRVPQPAGRDEMAQVVDTLNDMLASLESATQTQRRFVADASHELRAPLTTIQGNLSFLQRHFEEIPLNERRAMLADAHGETLRLKELVEELLLLARADASMDIPLERQEMKAVTEEKRGSESLVELDHALLRLVRQLRGRLTVEGSKLKLEIGHIEPVRVRGDEESLRRVMLILLDNALKYTLSNGKETPARVIVSLERVENQAVLRLRDTGIGIDPADLPHIFERFYRADRARSREGTGLGLSIAQTIVEGLGGHITAESTLGQGSTFSVWLPLA